MEAKKIKPEQLEKIKNLQQEYANVTASIGQLHLRSRILNEEMENIQKEITESYTKYDTLRKSESDLIAELSKEYGDGTLSIETGEFIPVQK